MKCCPDEHDELLNILRCTAGEILFHLCPDKLDGVEFRCTGREVVNMDTWMLCQKRLHFLALVNRRFIPYQYDRASDMPKQMLQKVNDLLPRQVTPVRLGAQSDLASSRRDQQCSNGVDVLIMLNTGANLGRLPPWCPSAFDRTDQRLSIFVNKYQGCPQVAPLFLSWAKHTASNGQWPDRHVERQRAVVSGNSSACVVTDARRHWACTVP